MIFPDLPSPPIAGLLLHSTELPLDLLIRTKGYQHCKAMAGQGHLGDDLTEI